MSAFEVEYDCTPYIILLRIKLWGIQSAPKPVFRSTNFCMLQISIFEILIFVYCIQWKFFHPVMRYPWFKYNEFVFFSSCGILKMRWPSSSLRYAHIYHNNLLSPHYVTHQLFFINHSVNTGIYKMSNTKWH